MALHVITASFEPFRDQSLVNPKQRINPNVMKSHQSKSHSILGEPVIMTLHRAEPEVLFFVVVGMGGGG